jgi:hypothetical protein
VQLTLKEQQRVAARVPDRRPAGRQNGRELQLEQCAGGFGPEIEVAAEQDAAGLAAEHDRRAVPIVADADDARVRSYEVRGFQYEVRTTGDGPRVILVRGDLDPERLAVSRRVAAASAVGDEQQGRLSCAADEPERALAERRRVDEQVAPRAVEDDVLALVLERLVQLEDPGAKLVNVYFLNYSIGSDGPTRRSCY